MASLSAGFFVMGSHIQSIIRFLYTSRFIDYDLLLFCCSIVGLKLIILKQSLYMLYSVFQSTNTGSLTGDLHCTRLGREQAEFVSVNNKLFEVKIRQCISEHGAV